MAEDWTARGSLAGLDIAIRGGRADDQREYLVLALKGAPDLEHALARLASLPMAPWVLLNPWQPWLELWRAAWAPWLALAAPSGPSRPAGEDRP